MELLRIADTVVPYTLRWIGSQVETYFQRPRRHRVQDEAAYPRILLLGVHWRTA